MKQLTYRGMVCRLKPINEIKDPVKKRTQIEWAVNQTLESWRPEEYRNFFFSYLHGIPTPKQ